MRLLMHKNTVVAKLDCSDFYLKNLEIVNGYYMPFSLTDDEKENNQRFFDWKRSRPRPCMSQNFNKQILDAFKINPNDISLFLSASLIDCYWIKPDNIDLKWEDINYFDNKNEKIEKVVLSDDMYKYSDSTDLIRKVLEKEHGYKRQIKYFTLDSDNNYCVVKTSDILNNGQDVFNEIIGNILEDFLDINGAQYYLFPYNYENENFKINIPLIASELTIQDDTKEMITLNNLVNTSEFSDCNLYEYLISLGFKQDVNKMLILDYLMLNSERSLDNIALIRNSNTLVFESLAPLYDLGNSFNFNPDGSIKDIAKPFMETHKRQIELVDDFSFIDFDNLKEAVNVVDAVISYSSMSQERKELIIKTLSERIESLKEVACSVKKRSSIAKVRASEKIQRRFKVDEIIKLTGIDPIVEQECKNLFINYLSIEGRKEFDEFDKDNPNIKDRFDKFKKDTLCIFD